MATTPDASALAAALALLDRPVKTATREQVRATLRTKCPRFMPSSAAVLPMKSPLYWARRAVENVPRTELVGADGQVVGFAFGGARVASMKAA